MDDTSGPSRPQQDNDQLRHTLTVHEVSERLTASGVPRSERQIKRYCESGFLDAKKVPGPFGGQWFIAPAAIPKLVGDLQQWQMQRPGHGETRPATTVHVLDKKTSNEKEDTSGLSRPRPDVTDEQNKAERGVAEPDTSIYVTQLEKRIEEKDEFIGLLKDQLKTKDQQISTAAANYTSLSDRFADTQKLLGAMQRMFAPLLGQGDPYSSAENRAADASVDNSQS